MAITSIGARSSGVSGSSSTTVTQTPGATVAVGRILLVFVVYSNASALTVTVTDAVGGNTYTQLAAHQSGSANVAVFMCRVATQLASSTVITATFSSAIVDKCIASWEYSVGAGKTLAEDAAEVGQVVNPAGNGFGSAAHSGLSSKERLYARCGAKLANSTTGITQTTNFTTWALTIRSRNNASAIIARAEHRINTSTGETSNPTLAVSGVSASEFLALAEYDVPEASTTPSTFTDASVGPTQAADATSTTSSTTSSTVAPTTSTTSSTTPSTIALLSVAPSVAAGGSTSVSSQAMATVDPTGEESPNASDTTPSTIALALVAPATLTTKVVEPAEFVTASATVDTAISHTTSVAGVELDDLPVVATVSANAGVAELELVTVAPSSTSSFSTVPSEIVLESVYAGGEDEGSPAPCAPSLRVSVRFGF